MDTTGIGNNVALLEFIVLAVLFAFIVMKLRSVLGRRTGEERRRPDPFTRSNDDAERANGAHAPAADNGGDNVVALPRHHQDMDDEDAEDRLARFAPKGSPLAQALLDIQLADRAFEPEDFMGGAKSAYEMIVTAFAAGDRATLKPLLSKEVMADFDAAIADRESRGETVDFQYVGLISAKLTEASLIDRIAELTVKFVSEVISVKKNSDGAVIEGDPSAVRQVTDVWTFARDTRSADPNWELVGTAG